MMMSRGGHETGELLVSTQDVGTMAHACISVGTLLRRGVHVAGYGWVSDQMVSGAVV